MHTPQHINDISRVKGIPHQELKSLESVMEKFEFKSNDYYLSLIDWDDPHDPIRRIIIPCQEELNQWGKMDASNEKK